MVRQNKLDRSSLESLFSGLSNACGEGQEPTQVEHLGSLPYFEILDEPEKIWHAYLP